MPGYVLSCEPTPMAVSVPLWRALRQAKAPATINELHRVSKAHPNSIQLRLKRWRAVGFIDVLPAEEARYAIAPKAAHLEKSPTFGSLSADAWAALRRIGRAATFDEILAASGASDRPLYCRLRRWCRTGFVIKTEAVPSRFALSGDAPDLPDPPHVSIQHKVTHRPRTARERMWAAMRVLKSFDVPLLMMTAEAKRRSCEDFINLLSRAGYLRRDGFNYHGRGGRSGGGARDWSTYQLIRSTGPKCPSITHRKGEERQLVDRNNGQSFPVTKGLLQRAREVNHVR